MRHWNTWGYDDSEFVTDLGAGVVQPLESLLGPGQSLPDATLEEVIDKVPLSRLAEHPLISLDAETRVRHARGQSFPDLLAMRSGEFGAFPDGVAFPESSAQVRELLQHAADNDVALIPYGGGTSVVGHINPDVEDARPVLTVDMSRMSALIALDKESQLATIGAGASGPQVEEQLQQEGYTLGHFPQSWELSTLGGWVASRSSGQQSLCYGRIEQLFAGGTVETPAGTLEIPAVPASSAGPDIREMVLGSEGRMGIITEVKVRVSPLPEKESFHVIFFPDWQAGMATAKELAQQKTQLSMVRLSNAMETALLLQSGADADALAVLGGELAKHGIGETRVMMTIGVTGSAEQCEAALSQTTRCVKRHGGFADVFQLGERWAHGRFRAPYLRELLWTAGFAVDTMETAVDWSKVNEAMHAIEAAIAGALADEGEKMIVYTHLSHVYGQGSSIYTTYLFRCADSYEETSRRWQKIKAAGAEQIVAFGGTISHQHGVGVDHREYLAAEKGALGIAAIRNLCQLFDPAGQLNPGKLLPDDE
jgi:alkyldihydroxyacetonephosphate synthase